MLNRRGYIFGRSSYSRKEECGSMFLKPVKNARAVRKGSKSLQGYARQVLWLGSK